MIKLRWGRPWWATVPWRWRARRRSRRTLESMMDAVMRDPEFDRAMNQAMRDVLIYGHAHVHVEEGPDGVRLVTTPHQACEDCNACEGVEV